MKKILFTLLILSTLFSCRTKHTYILESVATDSLFLYETTSEDTVKMIEQSDKYLSSVPYSLEKQGVFAVKGANYHQDAKKNRNVSPYLGEDYEVIWTDVQFHIVQKPPTVLIYGLSAIAVIAIAIICAMLYVLNGIGAR